MCVKMENNIMNNCLIYKGTNLCNNQSEGYPALDILFDATYIKIENCADYDT